MSCNSKQVVVVLCSSEETRQIWLGRRVLYDDVELEPIYPSSQAWRIVKELLGLYDEPLVVCQDSIWFGAGFGHAVGLLLEEIGTKVQKWGACGNRGSNWEGSIMYDYTRFAHSFTGVRTGFDVRPVLTLDDNLVLLNCKALRECQLVDLGTTASLIFGVPLSLECLRYELPLLVSPYLFTLRSSRHNQEEVEALTNSAHFKSYYREHFFNHALPWPDGEVDVQDCVDYEYIMRPDTRARQSDILALFDDCLTSARLRSPSLTLCCRTQFTRPELLHRAITSFAMAQTETTELLDLNVRLVSDREESVSEPYIRAFREEFPTLEIECWRHAVRQRRFSRADLLLAAIEQAGTDYIWFVDDDDYVLPGAIEALSRTLQPAESVITIANSLKVEEKWSAPDPSPIPAKKILEKSRTVGRFPARDIFRVFSGQNFIPVCSLILPVRLTTQRLKDKHALGDYNEDYFVLLTALTSPQVEVRVLDIDVCGVSLRETGNTVTETDRSKWHFSYATFLREVLAADDRNPLLWQLGTASY